MSSAGQLSDLYAEFSKDVQFFLVYCREAHPIDGKNPGSKPVEDPISDAERRSVAKKFVADMNLEIPTLLDGVDDAVGKAYASHPDRLYLIGKDGLVAYAGDRGPFGFEPRELAEAIEDELFRIEAKQSAKDKPAKKKVGKSKSDRKKSAKKGPSYIR